MRSELQKSTGSVTDEKYNEKGFENVSNGVITARIEYDVESEEAVQNLSGATSIFGLKAVIIIADQKKRCHFCGDRSNIIRDCQIRKLHCEKCGLEGHHASKCSLAEKLKSIERSKIDYHDLEAVDNEICHLSSQSVANEDSNTRLGFTATLMDTEVATCASTSVAPILLTNVPIKPVCAPNSVVAAVAAVPSSNPKSSTANVSAANFLNVNATTVVTQTAGTTSHTNQNPSTVNAPAANVSNTITSNVVVQPAGFE